MPGPSVATGKWLLATLALGVASLTAGLGVWQLQRAQTKQALQASQQAAQRLPVVVDWAEAAEHRHAAVRGRWQTAPQFWLGNRPMQRQAGFILVTPLALADGRWLWVQRGWAPRAQDRFDAPPWPPTPEGEVTVHGRLAQQASRAFALDGAATGPVRQNLDPSEATPPGLKPVPWVLWQLDGCAPLRCEWPAVDAGVAKHHGYAAQWFALSALTLALYVWFQIIPRWRQRSS